MVRRLLWPLVALLVLAGGGYGLYRVFGDGASQPTYRLAKVERGAIQSAVSATGTINPVTTVQVGSQISGQLQEIKVDFNSTVKRDEIIARLDPQTFELRVAQARADVEAARASVEVARSGVAQQRAELARIQVTVADAERTFKRNKDLVAKNFLSPAELDKSQTAFDAAREQANAVQAQITTAEAQVKNAAALIRQRESTLKQAQVDLERTIIRAPVDGTVILRNVEVGQTVAASLQAPVLFTIARDLREMQVETSVDEADVGRLRVGQPATFNVDAFPRRSFEGKIVQIRKAAQNVQNVITYTVIVSTTNPDLALLPGMTANVRVVVESRDNVLRIPNAALRYRPTTGAEAAAAKAAPPPGPVADGPGMPPRASGAAKGGGGGGPGGGGAQAAMQMRTRILGELNLDESQKTQIESIFADARNRGMALRDIADEAERRRTAERNRAETRERINAVLKPEQRAGYERILAETFGGRASSGRIWVIGENSKPKSVDVRLGITDGSNTELIVGDAAGSPIQEGTEIIIGQSAGKGTSAPSPAGAGKSPGGPPFLR